MTLKNRMHKKIAAATVLELLARDKHDDSTAEYWGRLQRQYRQSVVLTAAEERAIAKDVFARYVALTGRKFC